MAKAESLRIYPKGAKDMVDAGEAIILDVVTAHAWSQMPAAIKGALRIDPDELEARWRELPRDRGVIAYCT